ncbi:MAG: peptide-methionine (S)-S-oxide reductase [Euryarchaeota archaeon RBG_16_68_13]|nr:MAG: peptide-methionine (S)-S-oxide reductase [Euryarchaeota archaeon RBG_16_68_13]
MDGTTRQEVAALAGGCFWCLQPVFQELQGVAKLEVGYTGGQVPNPGYELVCTDRTGHAEAIRIEFDPEVLPYEDLLRVFFTVHDPTTLNRQGPDVGSQYRSAVFYHTPEQKAAAERVIREVEAAGIWRGRIVTELAPFEAFYRAEEVHQDYFRKNPNAGYCRAVIAPKVAKFRKAHAARLRKVPA